MRPVFSSDNDIQLLESGDGYFPALIAAIDAAQAEVRLETYIFVADDSGNRVADALMRAAQRGVRVHVVVDGFGSPRFMKELGYALRKAGVEVLIYRPEVARLRFRRHRLRRLHRKLVCIDACVGFVGGINIIDDLNTPHQTPPRLDYAVRVQGSLVAEIHQVMCRLWTMLRWVQLGQRYLPAPPRVSCAINHGRMLAAFVIRDNLRHRRDIEAAYMEAFGNAQREILLANAYFLPGRRFRQALIAAAKRGVRVCILLQGRPEYRLLHYATQSIYDFFLKGNVEIYEYHRSFLHAKVAVVDGHWATVGSSNIDPFSLLLAREANVVVRDAAFSGKLHASLDEAMRSGAHRVAPSVRPSLAARFVNWCAYGLVRTIVGLAGYKNII